MLLKSKSEGNMEKQMNKKIIEIEKQVKLKETMRSSSE